VRAEFDAACKLSAIERSLSVVDSTMSAASEAGWKLLAKTPWEYEGRLCQPGYGTGRYAAEELRRGGQEERFIPGSAIVWQARVGRAAVVDTIVIGPAGLIAVTPPEAWPFKRITVKGIAHDVPDLLVREAM